MHPILSALGVTCVTLFTAVIASAAPVNDLFQNAIPLIGPIVTTTGDNIGASKNFGGEPLNLGGFDIGNFGGASVWWTWTAAASGQTTIDTEGSDFDTLLGVFTGTVPSQLTLVADNNDFGGNTWSRVQFNAVAGTVYRIVVDGLRVGGGPGGRASQGNITLNVKGVGGITFNSPTNGMVFTVGDPVPVEVTIDADFPNPPATRVDFYVGANLFASKTDPPFSAVATDLPPGTNKVYVIAFDNAGAPVQSPVVNVFVQSIGVTLLTPFEDTVYQNTDPITVTAWGYLPGGSITNIEFFVDGVKFGDDDAPPFSGVWSNVVGGSHRFTAVGRSETGARYNSQAVNIGVATSIVASNSIWKYLDDGSDQGVAWITPDFNDDVWASGPAPLGYSDSNGRLPLTTTSFGPDASLKFTTTYFRQEFEANSVASFTNLLLKLQRDDGAVVYLNGAEVGRFNMPTGAVTSATFASVNANDDGGTTFTTNIPPNLFIDGLNVFAVEIHQDSPNSSDIWFVMEVLGLPIIIHNLSPVVELTVPTNGTYWLAPAEMALAATAADGDGSVAKVEFFADGVKIGEDATEPYEAVWSNPPVAAHLLTAVATDDQGATTTSAEIAVVVYDAAGTPVAKITAPPDGHVAEGPTNMLVTATANAITGVTNVQFLANGVEFANDDSAPYSAVWPAPFGTNVLTAVAFEANGASGSSPGVTVVITIPPTNVIAPTIAVQTPLAGETLTNFTTLNVIFSERVQKVDAADLLINGVAATNVTGNGSLSNYTFTFPQPPYGAVNITWAGDHGITDYGYPSNLPFAENGPGATWSYDLIDVIAPRVAARTPAPGAIVTNVTEISVTFSEAVSGVDGADLLVNGIPALGVSGAGANYTFSLPGFGSGLLIVTWATNHDIFDLAVTPNPFNRALATNNWSFTLDTRHIYLQTNSTWRFLKGTAEASDPTNAWRQLAYDDTGWSNAPAPFFYGETSLTNASYPGTTLSDMQSNYTSIYLRSEFTVENRGNITNLLLFAQVDDGFIAWINGVQMVRVNVPAGELAYNRVASVQANEPQNNGAAWVVYQMPASAAALVDGTNVLAVHAFNQNLTNSTDFSFNAQLYTYLLDPTTVGPRLLGPEPAQGDAFYLTNLVITFSESVSGVDASDLLVNGAPAASMTSATNTVYSFSFAQPPYGPVLITWDTNHGIVDFDGPPKAFNDAATNATLRYFLINPSNPRIATQAPLSGSTLTGLTSIIVTFTEPVSGVEAADLLVNTVAASAVERADNISYTFSFVQPSFGPVAIRWATNHSIVDVEAGNAFDPTRFGGQWNYTLINPVPSVALTSPTNNTFFLPPANLTLRATASDNDGTVALVEFFEGTTKLGEGTNAPYVLGVSNLPLGSYVFRAVATDNIGLIGTSAPVVINVVTSLPITLVRGPYLQSGSPTGGVVRWRTDFISDGVVYYGTDLANLTNVAVETSVTNEHIVPLAGLEPNTQYFYSIGSSAFRLVGGTNDGANYWLKTSPPVGARQATRLWVLGDAGTAGNGSPLRQASTRDAFYNFAATNGGPADLVMMLGDNAYNSGTDAEHQAAVFDMYPAVLRNKFLWPTLGNHETSQSTTATDFPYLHIFSLPRQGEAGGVPSGTELYYSFDYGNIHFVCLDSMTSGRSGTTTMARWLEDDLAGTAQEWIIVFFHHPPYTKGSHNSDTEQDLVELRQNIVPILEANGVDLVLNGHSHSYERSYLIDGHYGLSTTLTDSMKLDDGDGQEEGDGAYRKSDEGRGVVYNVAGSSGQATFATTPDGTFATTNHPAMFISMLELGSLVIDVSKNRLDAQFINDTGVIRDHYTLLKPDLSPVTPLHLVALPGSATEITLAWTPGATNQEGYSIERSLDGVTFTEQLLAPGDATGALDAGLLANTTYFYRVRSTNAFGISDYSNVASATTVLPVTLPEPPAALVAASDDGVRFYRSQMILNWQDRSTNEAAFQIERSADGILFIPIATVAANITTYRDHHLASGTVYYYQVRAFNALGHSAPSNPAGDITHPQSQLALAGTSATFHAGVEEATGYQWLFEGVPLAGQTNETLIIATAQPVHEGAYTVAVTNAAGLHLSNPAWLFVLVPPYVVEDPVSHTNILGGTASFHAAAGGTAPLYYQWRKDGVDLPGASGPQLTLGPLSAAHQGQYEVVVRNEFGTATSQAAWLIVTDNRRPELAALPDYFLDVLKGFSLTNRATDPDPANQLTFALEPGAPTNATLHPVTGVFRWTPTRRQAPGTNLITVRVDDNGIPNLSDTKSFTLIVNDYLEAMGGNVIVNAGQTTNVTLGIYSSAGWTGVDYELDFPGDLLTDLTVETLAPELVSATLQMAELATPGLGTARISFTAMAGQVLQGTQEVARLHFTAVAGQASGFVPLNLRSLTSTMAEEGVVPTLLTTNGRVVVLGAQALLEPRLTLAGQRQLVIYGRPGAIYTLQSRFTLSSGTWANRLGITLSNVTQTVVPPSPTAPIIYFRLRE